jgi:import inner membrane translocase subunit TIM8
MDSLGGGIANADLSKLSDRDKQELQQFAMNEGQKARIQSCTCLFFPFILFIAIPTTPWLPIPTYSLCIYLNSPIAALFTPYS